MTIVSLLIIILVYRWYLFYKKQNDKHAIEESRKIYLDDFYKRHVSYYLLLTASEKQEFVKRSLNIRKHIAFHTINDLLISENIKILIGASFTELTFGFTQKRLDTLSLVFAKPTSVFTQWVNTDVKSHIGWSWDAFVKGFMFDTQKRNLVLQKLSNALYIEFFERKENDSELFKEWLTDATAVMEASKLNPNDEYFNGDKIVTMNEFFALVVTSFFDDAQAFRSKAPQLYSVTCKLLGQDVAEKIRQQSNPR